MKLLKHACTKHGTEHELMPPHSAEESMSTLVEYACMKV